MLASLLQRKHSHYREDALQRRRDLFEGGEAFRERVKHYLLRNDMEPPEVYDRRCKSAHYVNYTAPLVNLFASWLFTDEPEVEPHTQDGEKVEPDAFYSRFCEDCDGLGTDDDAFLRARIVDSLVDDCAFWQVCFPKPGSTPESLAEWEQQGVGRATLRPIKARNVINWRRAKRETDGQPGRLLWLLEYQRDEELLEITDADVTVTETWTLWRADGQHKRWSWSFPQSKPRKSNEDVPEIEAPYDPTGSLPIVDLCLPHELRLVEHLSSAQLEHFRKRCALSWGMDRTCYVMPVLKTKARKTPPRMGAGYYLQLGTDESLEWPAPPSTPYDTIGGYIATLKDEIHRVAIAMAQGVDNNAAAIGRSGDSKQADANATEKVLFALGKFVVLVWERTLDLVSLGRGDAYQWTARGMDEYSIADVGTLVEQAVSAELLKIQSPTFQREMQTRLALATLGDGTDEATRNAIKQEIFAPDIEPAKSPADVLIGDYEAGLLTVNEIRARKGEALIAGGDVTTIVWKAQQEALAAKYEAEAAALKTPPQLLAAQQNNTAPGAADQAIQATARPGATRPSTGAVDPAARTSA